MRHLAVIATAACGVACAVAATVIVAAAPRRVVSTGLPVAPAWTHEYAGAPPVAAAVSGGGWLVAGFPDHLEMLSLATGDLAGTLPLPASRLACDATICVAGNDADIRAVDVARRTVRWQKTAPGPLAFDPAMRSGWLFLTTTDGRVAALRDTDGQTMWTYTANAPLTGQVSVDGERIAIATSDAAITLLDLRTGRAVWTTSLQNRRPGTPKLGGGMVYVGTENRDLLFISAADGRIRDTQRTGAVVVGAPALDEHFIYTGGQDAVLRAFARRDGALAWYANLPTRTADAGPVATQNLTAVALRNGAFQIYLPDGDGKRPAAAVSAPGEGDSSVALQLPPIIAGDGTTLRLVTITTSVGDVSKWSASVTATAPPLPLTALPAKIPGLALTLPAPR